LEFLIEHGSYLAIVSVLILCGCGLPIPEELPVITAAVLSAEAMLNPWFAYISCIVGAILGDCVMYWIGYHWGHSLLKEHPRFAHLLKAEREQKYEQRIQQHGLRVLFIARFMVVVRGPVFMSAGVLRVSFWRFLLADLLCGTIVVSIFFWLSYAFGSQIAQVVRNAEIGITAVAILAVVVGVGYFLWRRRRRLARLRQARQIRVERNRQRKIRLDQLGKQEESAA